MEQLNENVKSGLTMTDAIKNKSHTSCDNQNGNHYIVFNAEV